MHYGSTFECFRDLQTCAFLVVVSFNWLPHKQEFKSNLYILLHCDRI